MSSADSDSNEKNLEKLSKKVKFAMQKIEDIAKLEKEEILNYVEHLHALLNKNDKKFKKYKGKIKRLVKKVEQLEGVGGKANGFSEQRADQVNGSEQNASTTEKTDDLGKTPLSLVDEIREAAEQAQNLTGFVYEPTSGLYYDKKTGYYYNAEYGLYYDGNTGCYYKYDQEKNEFEFHSQVSATETTAAASTRKTSNDNDIFDNYTIAGAADDNREEWGVIDKRPRFKAKANRSENRKDKYQQRKRKRRQRYSSTETSDSSDCEKISSSCDKRKVKIKDGHDMEDGEIDSSNSASDSQDNQSSYNVESDPENETVKIFNKGSRFQDIAKKYPPSLRIIVLESQLEEVKVGSLSLITFKGGTLGREGAHDVIIPDVNVSKFHLQFTYDKKRYIYKCIDLGSRNGTILNGSRMSTSKMESQPFDLVHGSVLQIGQTKLLCHVHEGNSTCGQCEPGLLIETGFKEAATPTVTLTHKEQLKKIQKKYGLENDKFIEHKTCTNNSYNDRAATRRIKVGSSTDKEKTQMASVDTAISSENKGFKMLSKLGWSKGEALGKPNDGGGGLLEPINVSNNVGKKGFGCDGNITSAPLLTLAAKTKLANLKKTQERYQKADIFQNSDNENSI